MCIHSLDRGVGGRGRGKDEIYAALYVEENSLHY